MSVDTKSEVVAQWAFNCEELARDYAPVRWALREVAKLLRAMLTEREAAEQELADERKVREAAEQAEMRYHKDCVAAEQQVATLEARVRELEQTVLLRDATLCEMRRMLYAKP